MKRQHSGFSIIELLIAVTLGLILTVGLISVFISSKRGYAVQESRARMQENARFAADYLARAVRLADFWGSVPPGRVGMAGGVTHPGVGTCINGWIIDPTVGIQGYLGGAAAPAAGVTNCVNDYVPNSDVLVVRYADTDTITPTAGLATAAGTGGQFFVRVLTGRNALVFNALTNLGTPTTAPAPAGIQDQPGTPGAVLNYRFRTEIFHVRTFEPANANVPSLYATRNVNNSMQPVQLVENIEMLKLEFGVDTNNDLVVDGYRPPNTVTNWGQVLTVRLNLMVRGDTLDNFTDTQTYNMAGGFSYTPPATAQRFQRMPLLKEVQVRNRVRVR